MSANSSMLRPGGLTCADDSGRTCNAGPSGSSIRQIMSQTGAEIRSWTDQAKTTSGRPSRIFVAEVRICFLWTRTSLPESHWNRMICGLQPCTGVSQALGSVSAAVSHVHMPASMSIACCCCCEANICPIQRSLQWWRTCCLKTSSSCCY